MSLAVFENAVDDIVRKAIPFHIGVKAACCRIELVQASGGSNPENTM